MDNSLVYIIIGVILYLFGILFKKFYLPKIRGAEGERSVARQLRRLNKNDYKVYNDIYLKINDRTTQIDHLVLSIYGIFVIETKTYKGWIFGNENSKYWTQTLFKKKSKIYNPIIQNWTHINFLKSISSDFRSFIYFPIIVFAGTAKLKELNSSVPVIYKRKLLKTIRRNKEIYITHNQLERINNILQQEIINKREIKRKHKKFVKRSIKRSNRNNTTTQTCPKCGGKLVIKNGKYGDFYGCSNYPKCGYSRNV